MSGFCSTRRAPSPSGFTLIEVLVVVAIISLLAAILIPSLVKAREQTTGVLCSTNMRQVMLGMHAYVAEHRKLPGNWDVLGANYPGPGPLSAARNWKPGDSWLGLPYVVGPAWNNPAVAGAQEELWAFVAATSPHKGSLYRYVRNEKSYLCPKDVPGSPEPENPKGGGGNGRFSYTMLGALGFKSPEKCTSFTYVADFQQKDGAKKAPYPLIKQGTKMVWSASKTLTLIEEHPWNNTNHGRPGDTWAADSYLAFRHHTNQNGGKAMFGFLDAHVESKQYPYFIPLAGTLPVQYNKFQGVDLLNEYRIPYSYAGNTGGQANLASWTHRFPYPY